MRNRFPYRETSRIAGTFFRSGAWRNTGRSFEQALADEESGRNRHLPSGQIAIYLFEDLQADASGLLRQIFGLLDVDESFVCDVSIQLNRLGVPRDAILNWMTRKRRWTTAVPEATRERLVHVYRADIERLEELLQRDLSHWKQPVKIPPAG